MNLMDLIIMLCSFAASFRMLIYSRSGSNFKRHISIIAYVCVAASGSLGLALLTQQLHTNDMPVLILPVIVVYTAFVFYAKGNVATVIRIIITGEGKC